MAGDDDTESDGEQGKRPQLPQHPPAPGSSAAVGLSSLTPGASSGGPIPRLPSHPPVMHPHHHHHPGAPPMMQAPVGLVMSGSPDADSDGAKPKRNRARVWSEREDLRALRLRSSAEDPHMLCGGRNEQRCVLCALIRGSSGVRTTQRCGTCTVPLCRRCFIPWHVEGDLVAHAARVKAAAPDAEAEVRPASVPHNIAIPSRSRVRRFTTEQELRELRTSYSRERRHFLVRGGRELYCTLCSRQRGRGGPSGARTTRSCDTCNIPLCANCFGAWHENKDLMSLPLNQPMRPPPVGSSGVAPDGMPIKD